MQIEIYRRNRDSMDDLIGSFESFEDCIIFILDGGILEVSPLFLDFEQALDAHNRLVSSMKEVANGFYFSSDVRTCARIAAGILKEVSKMQSPTDLIAYGPLDGDGFPVFPPQNYVMSEQMIKAMILRLPLDKAERQDIIVEFNY